MAQEREGLDRGTHASSLGLRLIQAVSGTVIGWGAAYGERCAAPAPPKRDGARRVDPSPEVGTAAAHRAHYLAWTGFAPTGQT